MLHGVVHGRFDILGFTLDCSLVWTQGRHMMTLQVEQKKVLANMVSPQFGDFVEV